jgi:hypothetical protein
MKICLSGAILVLVALAAVHPVVSAATRKTHTVALGGVKRVPYSKAGDPSGAASGEDVLKTRPLIVDGTVKEWTTGELHNVTDRSFVVRRAIRLNDALPGEKTGMERWVWQRGPWLLVDRVTGHYSALKLPDFDPGVSQTSWFRDYAAYCGVTAGSKSLYAVVAQVAAHKAILAKKLAAFDAASHTEPVCGQPEWQRDPLRVTFHPTGKDSVSFQIVPGSAVLVEDSSDEAETSTAETK